MELEKQPKRDVLLDRMMKRTAGVAGLKKAAIHTKKIPNLNQHPDQK